MLKVPIVLRDISNVVAQHKSETNNRRTIALLDVISESVDFCGVLLEDAAPKLAGEASSLRKNGGAWAHKMALSTIAANKVKNDREPGVPQPGTTDSLNSLNATLSNPGDVGLVACDSDTSSAKRARTDRAPGDRRTLQKSSLPQGNRDEVSGSASSNTCLTSLHEGYAYICDRLVIHHCMRATHTSVTVS